MKKSTLWISGIDQGMHSMKRDLNRLVNQRYDILIIGAGIYGAAMAWEATLRGLSVALVEKADFGSATSANSLKIIHGGLRYLQHADFKRARESVCERRTLLRIAPHLIHPLPVLIPTYGYGLKGRVAFGLGLAVNELIGFDRNRYIADPQKHIPPGHTISREECLRLLPGVDRNGLTGGVLFYDAQVYNSERLPLAFLHSAKNAGAHLVNYAEVTGFLQNGNCVTGVQVRDVLTGNRFDIRARMVINTAGPWIHSLLRLINNQLSPSSSSFAKAINLVIRRPLIDRYAAGIAGQNGYRDKDAIINKGSRYLFFAPWRGRSLVGTDYKLYTGTPDAFRVTEQDIQSFLDEINQVYPSASLIRDDISFVHSGLIPITGFDSKTMSIQLAKHHEIHDHRRQGISGIISVIGVKYTTARQVARQAVDQVFKIWDQVPPPSKSDSLPLHGGKIEHFESFLQAEIKKHRASLLEEEEIRHLIYNYGSAYPDVLRYLNGDRSQEGVKNKPSLLKAQVLYGIHEEMAQKLTDIIFRRTEFGTAGYPEPEMIRSCAEIMRKEMGWSQDRIQLELEDVNKCFTPDVPL